MEEIFNSRERLHSTILIIEEDNSARPSLTRNLRHIGYRLLVAASVEDAIQWVSGTDHIHADLILIDLLGKLPEEALTIGRDLRAVANYHSQTPLVVMPEKVSGDLEGTDENIFGTDWICYYEDADQLQRLLIRLLQVERKQPT